MRIVTIGLLQEHCRTDGDDDALLEIYGSAAESAIERATNRNVYLTAADKEVAVAGIDAAMTSAYAAYDLAVASAAGISRWDRRSVALDRAETILRHATLSQDMVLHGLVLNLPQPVELGELSLVPGVAFDIVAAVLLTADHLYRNRAEVIAGQGSAAVRIPAGAASLVEAHRWIGPNT